MDKRFAFDLHVSINGLDKFSLSYLGSGIIEFLVLNVGTGDGGGALVILLSGNLIFDGAKGGFFSVIVLIDWPREDKAEG